MQINYDVRKIEKWATKNNLQVIRVDNWKNSRVVLVRDDGLESRGRFYMTGMPVVYDNGDVKLLDLQVHKKRKHGEKRIEEGKK